MIEVFGFNTVKGTKFEMRNTTVEEIKTKLAETFPKWSAETIDRLVANQAYYREVIPVEPEKKAKKDIRRGSCERESIRIAGFELNPLLALGQSLHAYRKHSYKNWGNAADKMLSNPDISAKYNWFEQKYGSLVETLNKRPRPTKQEITGKVIEMCDAMDSLKEAVDRSGYAVRDSGEHYISGHYGKLGMGQLMKRVSEMTSDCTAALK